MFLRPKDGEDFAGCLRGLPEHPQTGLSALSHKSAMQLAKPPRSAPRQIAAMVHLCGSPAAGSSQASARTGGGRRTAAGPRVALCSGSSTCEMGFNDEGSALSGEGPAWAATDNIILNRFRGLIEKTSDRVCD
ncbi:hypothetical protein AAFF_G00154200 [Aldrovandia affinis]|uniref:Uncharacterized protein n=1 Tax=Aldrovandia affinis TaxID=143900 RepID=A0AAD7SZT7_9TELE|nr:hypothetical protein AAFF_G00154200 [Aldrovandia affinis]